MKPGCPLAMAIFAAFGTSEPAGGSPLAERVAQWSQPEMRRIDQRLGELTTELETLPELLKGPLASRYGFRSETLPTHNTPDWVQIDLGKSWPIDLISAVPVHIPDLGERGAGYGFPQRFKIEVADDPHMDGSVTVVDQTAADFANPGRYPVNFRFEPTAGRYVRFTSTRHFLADEGHLWALEELFVLSGNLCVAVEKPAEASSGLDVYPNWSIIRLNDGMSSLGLPVTVEPSPTKGHLSSLAIDPMERKWLRVDLGGDHEIDEIRIIPVEPETFEVLGWRAIPRAWRIELADDPEFERVVWSYEQPPTNLVGYPGGSAVMFQVPGRRARHLRLVALELWGAGIQQGFGVAELQAYSGGKNIALGKPVAVSDSIDLPPDSGWAPEFVTNGFSSRHRLAELPEHLDQLALRGRLEAERDDLLDLRANKIRTTMRNLTYGGRGVGGAALLGLGLVLLRQRAVRRTAVAQLRDQIARDLHDDIGSNLGGIVLLGEIGSRHSADPQAREDFAAITEAAEATSKSMQDIVWLIGRGNASLRDVVARMRHSAQMILSDTAMTLTVNLAAPGDRQLSLFLRRHLLFAFKESLNNVRRHAGAKETDVKITVDGRELTFEIRDDGVGFDPQLVVSGHGLANLQRRAERLNGSCRVESTPGQGTRVTFRTPLKS